MNRLFYMVQTAIGLILRHPMFGVCLIPILPEGQIALVKRRDNGCWSLPGGMVDWGETIDQAMKRELSEETGLTITRRGRLVGLYSAPNRDPRFHSICVAIEVYVQGKPLIKDIHELSEVQLFTLEEASQKNLSHDHTQILEDYHCGKTSIN
ncbi:MAG: NUDIX hydrolase [Acaryochloridaceae cyanobacterium SU_2_1]|nr:NUDIX hydrolase [Acaryochloridaceae cyanobacterium SU_2_1]